MKINISKDSLLTVKEFFNCMKNQKIAKLVKMVGFVKRNDGKLLATTFVKVMTLGMMNVCNPTL